MWFYSMKLGPIIDEKESSCVDFRPSDTNGTVFGRIAGRNAANFANNH